MSIYIFLLVLSLSGFLVKKRKIYKHLALVFITIILVSALRKYTIGIDMYLHYAKYYTYIASSRWTDLYRFTGNSQYDIGYVVFCKLISYISTEPQALIIISSIVIYGGIWHYIRHFSDNAVIETIMFMTSFMMFMYMNIIAQAMACSIILLGMKYLAEKKYIKYSVFVIIATLFHSSAIICFVFIVLNQIPLKRKNVFIYLLALIVASASVSRLLPLVVSRILPQYYWYLEGNIHGQGTSISTFYLLNVLIYVMCVGTAIVINYLSGKVDNDPQKVVVEKGREHTVPQLSTNFLMYMGITAITCRVLVANIELIGRIGYYFYIFTFSLLGRSLSNINYKKNKQITTAVIVVLMVSFYVLFMESAGTQSYGVVPYEFFWAR